MARNVVPVAKTSAVWQQSPSTQDISGRIWELKPTVTPATSSEESKFRARKSASHILSLKGKAAKGNVTVQSMWLGLGRGE